MRILTTFTVALVLACSALGAQERTPSQHPAPDNTKMNRPDRDRGMPTADQQKENQPDREIARQIRRSVVKDKTLSSYAHNVKIIAQNGVVTLKGPVRSEEEKQTIASKAAEVVGSMDKVKNELSIKQ